MYNQLKQILKQFIPKRFLFQLEPGLRHIHYRFNYAGSRFQCNVCGSGLKAFIELPNGNLICPNCGSSNRDRRLWDIISPEYVGQNLKHLDFSPSRSLFRKLKSVKQHQHIATDISGDFIADEEYDITKIDAKDGSFDLITCYHVLEHIPDDKTAMEELYRVLDEKGTCFIQTPFKDGDIYEDPSITSEADRLKHFGQEDHVRIYSVEGLTERLVKVGFKVEELCFKEQFENRYGFKEIETVLKCNKN